MPTPDNKPPKKPEKPAEYVPPPHLDPDKALPDELLKFIMARTTELPAPAKKAPEKIFPPAEGAPKPAAPPADLVAVKCLCGKVLRAPKSLCGQPVKCPHCGKTFRLPTPK